METDLALMQHRSHWHVSWQAQNYTFHLLGHMIIYMQSIRHSSELIFEVGGDIMKMYKKIAEDLSGCSVVSMPVLCQSSGDKLYLKIPVWGQNCWPWPLMTALLSLTNFFLFSLHSWREKVKSCPRNQWELWGLLSWLFLCLILCFYMYITVYVTMYFRFHTS